MSGLENIIVNFKSIGVFIIVLSILILVHEWGHFIVARLVGVSVEKFSIGFGKKLFSVMRKGTEFMVCMIPLGGYVKMKGDERANCKGDDGEFYSKSLWRRAVIIISGPLVNYLFALFCLIWVFSIGYQDTPAKIGDFLEGSPALSAGLMAGDEIIKVNSRSIYGWNELATSIAMSKGQKINISVVRNGKEKTFQVFPNIIRKKNIFGQIREIRRIEVIPYSNIIGEVLKDSSAEKAGLKKGDRIVKVDSTLIKGWMDLSNAIKNSTNKSIYITYSRNGNKDIVEAFPKVKKIKDKSNNEKEVRLIGISPLQEYVTYKFSIKKAISQGYRKLIDITVMTYEALYYMVTGAMSPKNAAGPVGIFVIVKIAAELGFSHLLFIVGVISASLAIFNLLPIIPLDGGHLLIIGIEKIRGGRPLPEKVEEWIGRIGFSLIIVLALFIFYNDFVNIGLIDKIRGLMLYIKTIVFKG